MARIIIFISICFLSVTGLAQDTDKQLAQHYYSSGEFDKAVVYYERLYNTDYSKFNFNRYLECLTEIGEDKKAEKTIKKAVNANKYDQYYSIYLAKFYEQGEQHTKANKIYENLIENLNPNSRNVIELYNSFKAQSKNDLAYKTLLKGRKVLKKSYPLNFQFAEYYGSIGETEKMLDEYLDLIDYHQTYINSVQRVLSAQIDFTKKDSEEYRLLKGALIGRTQKNPNDLNYAEMLTWLFVQRNNFSSALIHVKAMDKRNSANGRMVYDLGNICIENKDYLNARKSFKYVVTLGEDKPYFMRAQNALLNVNFLEVTTRRNFKQDELEEIIEEYRGVLKLHGKSRVSLPIILELAHIQAFYANQGLQAIELLDQALMFAGLTAIQIAEIKMELADIHVLHGDIWEGSLLYMQIDKDFKYEPIGHEAKFKNARIFYYDAEFDFAQSQLDVLKQSTSKLIANDALKLSLLITDNYGLDSNFTAMSQFAKADLFIEQHRYKEAFLIFDSILLQFPAHSLGDEILFKKAHAMQLKGQWNEAILNLETLLKLHGGDILADDALFQLGNIYQNHLFDEEKAAEYYRIILFDYKGSLYTTEARKRFQKLRKSKVEEDKIEG